MIVYYCTVWFREKDLWGKYRGPGRKWTVLGRLESGRYFLALDHPNWRTVQIGWTRPFKTSTWNEYTPVVKLYVLIWIKYLIPLTCLKVRPLLFLRTLHLWPDSKYLAWSKIWPKPCHVTHLIWAISGLSTLVSIFIWKFYLTEWYGILVYNCGHVWFISTF